MNHSRVGNYSRNIFVIDDDAALVSLVSLALGVEGFDVRCFTSSLEALASLATDAPAQPAAIVLDLDMPEMDGKEFYKSARDGGYENPVLILSAYGARKAQQELGAEDFLQKPFDPHELATKLRSLPASR